MTPSITDTLEEYGTDTPLPNSGRDDYPTTIIADWTHRGIRCAIYNIRERHYCGYVQMPEELVGEIRTVSTYDEIVGVIEADLNVNGGITYGPDDDGWVGFDTAHSWDRCVDKNGNLLPNAMGAIGEADRTWNPDSVKQETVQLAEQVIGFE